MEIFTEKSTPQGKLVPLIHFFKCFFDLGSIVLLVPFQFKAVNKAARNAKQVYKIHSHRFHKILCIIFQALIVLEYILVIRLIPNWGELNEKRINILHSGNLIACLIYSVALIYMFWFKKAAFVAIFNQLQDEGSVTPFLHARKTKYFWSTTKVKVFCYGICLFGYGIAMTHPIIHGAFIFSKNDNLSFFQNMKLQAESCFLLSDLHELENSTDTSSISDESLFYTISAFILTIIHILLWIPSTILVHMLDLFALLITICCWRVVNCFIGFCKELETTLKFEDAAVISQMVLSEYGNLKRFIRNVNDATGLVFLCCIGISLPFYASWTAVLFFEEDIDWFEVIHFYVYFCTFLVVLTMAANINRRANEFYDWLSASKFAENIPPNTMTSLMMDLYANRIALSGCGVFVLTFRFFVTILSIIVTYTSIIVQFQIGRRDATLLLLGNNTH